MQRFKHFETHRHEDVLVITLREVHGGGYEAANKFLEETLRLLGEERPTKVVIDFNHAYSFGSGSTCDALFKGALVRIRRALQEFETELRLCEMPDFVREAFRMSNLEDAVFAIDDTLDDSLRAFGD